MRGTDMLTLVVLINSILDPVDFTHGMPEFTAVQDQIAQIMSTSLIAGTLFAIVSLALAGWGIRALISIVNHAHVIHSVSGASDTEETEYE